MEKLEIGKITKPQGIKGEFRLRPNTVNFEHYTKIKKMQINGVDYAVTHVSLRNGFVVVKVNGIDDRNIVEGLVGSVVRANVADIELQDGEYLNEQLIGCKVYDNDSKLIGEVSNINNFGAGDIYTVLTNTSKEIMFPNVRGVIVSVDATHKKIVIDRNILNEIVSE